MINRDRLRPRYRRADNVLESERLAEWLLRPSRDESVHCQVAELADAATARALDVDALDVLARACSILTAWGYRW